MTMTDTEWLTEVEEVIQAGNLAQVADYAVQLLQYAKELRAENDKFRTLLARVPEEMEYYADAQIANYRGVSDDIDISFMETCVQCAKKAQVDTLSSIVY